MTLEELGYNIGLEEYRMEQNLSSFDVGRVISEHKDRYTLKTPMQEYNAELIGNLRFTATDRYDFPAVGDWVAFSSYDEDKALIHAIYPRHSIIKRQAVGKASQIQIIATNIDYGLIVLAVGRDYNLNRIERYLTICNASNVAPIVVLNKIDLIEPTELEIILTQLKKRIANIQCITVSSETIGYDKLKVAIEKGKTYCLLGSSGVGKSTLVNNLSGKKQMKTGEISVSVNRGRHITSHRELIVLGAGGILIDNPGMREVGIADTTAGLEATFEQIMEFAQNCRFKDCTHRHEVGCAVLKAIDNEKIDPDAYHNFQKMEREKEHFESSALERRRKGREFGKLVRKINHLKKQQKGDKF